MKVLPRCMLIIFVSVVLFLLIFVQSFRGWQGQENSYLEDRARDTETAVFAILSGYENVADLIVHVLVERPEVEKCLAGAWESDSPATRDLMRGRLYDFLRPVYHKLALNGFPEFEFHLPDNTSFLRFHNPEKFGDDLTDIRPTVVRTSRERTKTMGFEQGPFFNGYRFVYPLFDGNRYVGSVEVGVSLFSVARELSRINKAYGTFPATLFLTSTAPSAEARVSGFSEKYFVDQKFSSMSTSDFEAMERSVRREAIPLMEKGETFALSASLPGREMFLVEFLPMEDIEGAVVGYIVHSYQDKGFSLLRRLFYFHLFSLGVLVLAVLLVLIYRYRFISRLRCLAGTDPLTGVLNRRAMLDRLEEKICLVDRYSRPHSLIMFDVDHLKQLNDGFGHALGDLVLKEIVDICRRETRTTDFLARWGGDEFLILLGESDVQHARIVAERIRRIVDEKFASEEYSVTISLGVFQIPAGKAEPDGLLACADDALYRAKANGRNRVEVAGTETATEQGPT